MHYYAHHGLCGEMIVSESPRIEMLHGDCMSYMATLEDKAFQLACVDPPYGIGNFIPQHNSYGGSIGKKVEWNNSIPDFDYFTELRRISEHRIIWGANYYNCFEEKNGALVWYKGDQQDKFSHCEIASQTYYKKVDYVHINWQSGFYRASIETIVHPCQKPVALYKWLLHNYAKKGDRIFDSHGGSGSSAIACYEMGYDMVWIEKDEDYYNAAVKRFKNHAAQEKLLFTKEST